MRCGQALECIQRFFGFRLLHDTHNGVENDDEQNEQRFKKFLGIALGDRNDERNDGGGDQNQNHRVTELVDEAPEHGFLLFLLQTVFAVFRTDRFDLFVGQAACFIGGKGREQFFFLRAVG